MYNYIGCGALLLILFLCCFCCCRKSLKGRDFEDRESVFVEPEDLGSLVSEKNNTNRMYSYEKGINFSAPGSLAYSSKAPSLVGPELKSGLV